MVVRVIVSKPTGGEFLESNKLLQIAYNVYTIVTLELEALGCDKEVEDSEGVRYICHEVTKEQVLQTIRKEVETKTIQVTQSENNTYMIILKTKSGINVPLVTMTITET